jgi:hypothetical protein
MGCVAVGRVLETIAHFGESLDLLVDLGRLALHHLTRLRSGRVVVDELVQLIKLEACFLPGDDKRDLIEDSGLEEAPQSLAVNGSDEALALVKPQRRRRSPCSTGDLTDVQ